MLDLETLFLFKNNLSEGAKYLGGFLSSKCNGEKEFFYLFVFRVASFCFLLHETRAKSREGGQKPEGSW